MNKHFQVQDSPRGNNYKTISTPIGTFTCYKFTDRQRADGTTTRDHPPGKPWHLTTTGQFFETPETAADWLKAIDYTEPTQEETNQQKAQDLANYRTYMYGVEYACGIRD